MMVTDINENVLTEGDRVVEPYGDSYPRIGTIDTLYGGSAYVRWDGDSETVAIFPTRLERLDA